MKHINIPEVGVKNLEPITGQLSMSPHFFSLHIPWILIYFLHSNKTATGQIADPHYFLPPSPTRLF